MKTKTDHLRKALHAIANPIAEFRIWLSNAVQGSPLWKALNFASLPVAAPMKAFARYSLDRMPWLANCEWLLETRSLATRAPFPIALSGALCTWRGIRVTQFGHIGTDRAIYPLIALVSSFNPYLGVCCAILFGAADLIQKLFITNDIYGAPNRFSLDYWGALMGYSVSYSALVFMALAPGVASRLVRRGMFLLASRVFFADGASERPHVPSLAEDLAAVMASTAAATLGMRDAVPSLEISAFYFRQHPDVSCFQMEIAGLQASAPYAGVGAGLGTAFGPTAGSDGLFTHPAAPHLANEYDVSQGPDQSFQGPASKDGNTVASSSNSTSAIDNSFGFVSPGDAIQHFFETDLGIQNATQPPTIAQVSSSAEGGDFVGYKAPDLSGGSAVEGANPFPTEYYMLPNIPPLPSIPQITLDGAPSGDTLPTQKQLFDEKLNQLDIASGKHITPTGGEVDDEAPK